MDLQYEPHDKTDQKISSRLDFMYGHSLTILKPGIIN